MRTFAAMGLSIVGVDEALSAFNDVKEAYGQDSHWVVGVGMEYGAYLEFGTSKMQAYPFLFPAARDVMGNQFQDIEQRALDQDKPMAYIVQELALAIENQAKVNADANQAAFDGQRSPGTHPDHPAIDKGFLVGSIEATPAGGLFGGSD